jgi:uncharacterized membrane protein
MTYLLIGSFLALIFSTLALANSCIEGGHFFSPIANLVSRAFYFLIFVASICGIFYSISKSEEIDTNTRVEEILAYEKAGKITEKERIFLLEQYKNSFNCRRSSTPAMIR